jgi:hypothetical protein
MAALSTQATGYEGNDATGVVIPAGALVVVAVRERDGSTIAVSSSIDGAFTRAVAAPLSVGLSEIWYKRNSAGGTASFTVTGGSVRDYNVSVWTGMQDVAVDTTNGATNSSTTSHTHGSVTPSAQALIVTALTGADNGGMTPHTGFTALNNAGVAAGTQGRQYYAYKLAHTGAVNPTHVSTNTITTDACCAAFLETAAGGGTTIPVIIHNLRQQHIL